MPNSAMPHHRPQDPPDEILVGELIQRRESAMEVLAVRHEGRLFRLAHRMLNDADEARDVVQEVFIGLWENPHSWKPGKGSFQTWLYRVTLNRSLNRLRARRLKRLIFMSSEQEFEALPDGGNSPEQDALRKERSIRVLKAFNSLPERQRIALHLRYSERLSIAEIAAVIRVSSRAVESLLYRGRAALKEKLKDYWYND